MKRFALVLAIVLFGAACTDATAPAKPSMSVPTSPGLLEQGNLPPPPADAVIDVTVNSPGYSGHFTGAYFANGASVEAGAAAIELGDPSLSFLGTAWLRFDNNHTLGNPSANARFQRSDDKLFGMGTLVLNDEFGDPHTIRIVAVTSFTNFDCILFECDPNPDCSLFADQCVPKSDCSFSREQCAVIVFDATVDDDLTTIHRGTATVFNGEFPCRINIDCVVLAPPSG